ncbi:MULTISPECIES: 3-isopropylmalate dehydratase [unclassified Achromobacter]|uniref:LeuD/DmdB family oxidoreductase small subunit n=1 Tax=unclassified Achromobacter TaxID=2626865 RepID=UPI000B51D5FF|nr:MULTISPECIES: 3-isopropylmalate dehydratase [unclassified Achromobacter]OWT79923.1 3-isopropylmalate dehydratase [Achromobacter sp. HZ34]OWT81807.1 3-isopropylmalate dehydratase [Achromobacter sp. HZ28]
MFDTHTDIISGPVFVLGDDVNTDTQCSGKYLPGKDEAFIAAQAFDGVAPGFAGRFQPGGIIAAGRHFGINSSREQAVHILHRMGVAAIVAPSFGRQFFRNAINNGLLVIEYDTSGWVDGDQVTIDLDASAIEVASRGVKQPLRPLPPQIRAILREGGLIPYLSKHPDWGFTQ